MIERIVCLDTSVLIKALTDEAPPSESLAARRLLRDAVAGSRLVAPAFAWTEAGSILRKKLRRGELDWEAAVTAWRDFSDLPIEYLEEPAIREEAWNIAQELGLPTLYDAAFIACAIVTAQKDPGSCEFWTADRALIVRAANSRLDFVRDLAQP